MRVRVRRGVDPVVCEFSNEVDAEPHNGDAEAGSGVAELVRQHRMLPPLIPPSEKLPSVSQWLRHNQPP